MVGARVGRNGSELAGVASNVAVNAGAGLLALKFSRGQELEADRLTVGWMIRAGYNPNGMLRLQERLGALGGKAGMLSTHPASGKRVRAVQSEIARLAAAPALLARPPAALVDEDALALATQDAGKARLDAALAEFADAQSGAALAPADAAAANVHIGEHVSLGDNVRIGAGKDE